MTAINISTPHPNSLSFVRSKIYGNELSLPQMEEIIFDITNKKYSNVQISAFITACASNPLNQNEILNLTRAMLNVSHKITWNKDIIVDKHCIGGVPGNRTTPIIVAIVTAFGLIMPKTSSRAITSPAGTADTMEAVTSVEFDIKKMTEIVTQENGCIVWGGAVSLSPADDILIHIERELNLDGEGQMVASILSKKIAAGSNHIVIDIPIGKTAKIRNLETANIVKNHLIEVGKNLSVLVKVIFNDGSQPVGNGIGPALEARDLVMVLQNHPNAPKDLREHSLILAGEILEFSPDVKKGDGKILAEEILNSGKAWKKFQAICVAQGGMRKIPQAKYQQKCLASKDGIISAIDNRRIAGLAKLAGAPLIKSAGIDLHFKVANAVKKDDVLFTIHSDSKEMLELAFNYFMQNSDLIEF